MQKNKKYIYEKCKNLLDNVFIYKGDIAENYVAQQLNINFEYIYYWKNF